MSMWTDSSGSETSSVAQFMKYFLGSLPRLRGALRRRAAGKLGIALVPLMLVKKRWLEKMKHKDGRIKNWNAWFFAATPTQVGEHYSTQ